MAYVLLEYILHVFTHIYRILATSFIHSLISSLHHNYPIAYLDSLMKICCVNEGNKLCTDLTWKYIIILSLNIYLPTRQQYWRTLVHSLQRFKKIAHRKPSR